MLVNKNKLYHKKYLIMISLDENYSLVLEYADGGKLEEYLKNNAKTFEWEGQLKFAKDISSALLCLHENEIVHQDLVSFNYCICLQFLWYN